MSPRRGRETAPSNDYDSQEEAEAPAGVSSADLTRRGEPEDIESLRRLVRGAAGQTSEEREYHRQVMGVTYRERFGRSGHRRCITFCRDPRHEVKRCQGCYGHAELRPMDEIPGDIEPTPGRRTRFWLWAGWALGHVWLGITDPWRLDQARMRDLLENGLVGLVVEVERICPKCEKAEEQ